MLTNAIRGRTTAHRVGRGFSLIELMVTVAVLAVGLALAAPSLSTQIANYRLRSAAEGVLNGLNYARAEAVRRNSNVSFTLDATGAGWTVAQISPATTLQTRANGEAPGVSTTSSTASRVVTFTPTGLVDTSGVRLSQIDLSTSVSGAETRRIDIFGGGLIRVCNVAITAVGDPRRC